MATDPSAFDTVTTVFKGLIPVGIVGILSFFLLRTDKLQALKDLLYKQKQANVEEKLKSIQAEKVAVEAQIPNIRKASVDTQEQIQQVMNDAAKRANDILKQDSNVGKLSDDLDKNW